MCVCVYSLSEGPRYLELAEKANPDSAGLKYVKGLFQLYSYDMYSATQHFDNARKSKVREERSCVENELSTAG